MSIPKRNSSKVGTGSNFFEILKEYIKVHKVGSAIGITVAVSLALSISISMSIIANIKATYEVKTSKVIEDSLKKDKQITDVQRTEIIRNLGFNTRNNTIITTEGNLTITNDDKAKLIDYMISNLNYYQKLMADTDENLNDIYRTQTGVGFESDWKPDLEAKLVKNRNEYKKEVDKMQATLFEFCGIDYKK